MKNEQEYEVAKKMLEMNARMKFDSLLNLLNESGIFDLSKDLLTNYNELVNNDCWDYNCITKFDGILC